MASLNSPKAPITRLLSTCATPKDRTPGVSIIHPLSEPNSRASAIAEDEVWRPRPVASLTEPVARSALSTKAFTKVDFPTPECPSNTVRFPARALRISSSSLPLCFLT